MPGPASVKKNRWKRDSLVAERCWVRVLTLGSPGRGMRLPQLQQLHIVSSSVRTHRWDRRGIEPILPCGLIGDGNLRTRRNAEASRDEDLCPTPRCPFPSATWRPSPQFWDHRRRIAQSAPGGRRTERRHHRRFAFQVRRGVDRTHRAARPLSISSPMLRNTSPIMSRNCNFILSAQEPEGAVPPSPERTKECLSHRHHLGAPGPGGDPAGPARRI